jgi:hypothetical protein
MEPPRLLILLSSLHSLEPDFARSFGSATSSRPPASTEEDPERWLVVVVWMPDARQVGAHVVAASR